MATCRVQMWALFPCYFLHKKQDQQFVVNSPPHPTRYQHRVVQSQAGDLLDPNICFSPMLQLHCCSAISPCQSSRVTSQLVRPYFSEKAGSAPGVYPVIWLCGSLLLTPLLLTIELGERASPTHWLICSSAQHAGTLLFEMWRADAHLRFSSANSLPHSARYK